VNTIRNAPSGFGLGLTVPLLCLLLSACSSKPANPVSPPALDPIGSKSVVEGQQLLFGVRAQSGGGAEPALTTSALPAGALFTDNLDGTGTFDWTPSSNQRGNHAVVFRATESGLSDSEIVIIQVTAVPPPPPVDTVFVTSDTVKAGDTAEVDLVLTNPDSAVASLYIWLRSAPGILYDTATALLPRFPVTSMSWVEGRHDSIQVVSLLIVDFTPPLDYIAPGTGPIMKLRFAVSPTQAAGVYPIDTTNVILPRALDISYRSGLSVPEVGFVAGQIVVQ
jgi:hypothetical protein